MLIVDKRAFMWPCQSNGLRKKWLPERDKICKAATPSSILNTLLHSSIPFQPLHHPTPALVKLWSKGNSFARYLVEFRNQTLPRGFLLAISPRNDVGLGVQMWDLSLIWFVQERTQKVFRSIRGGPISIYENDKGDSNGLA